MGPASAHLPLLLVSLTTTAAASAAATAASATAAVAAATAMAWLLLFLCGGHVAAVVLSFSVYDLTKLHRRFSLGGLAGGAVYSVFLRPKNPRNHFVALPIISSKQFSEANSFGF